MKIHPVSIRRLAQPLVVMIAVISLVAGCAATSGAQVTPAAGYTPPDDTPSIKVGSTIFADYSFTRTPKSTDADGNQIYANAFNVTRAYINVTGNISHVVSFRVTPDITRETGTGSSLVGSLTFRVKYAYAQFNLDDWLPRGSFVRLGIQQTPFIDSIEAIYRYRFQGTTFSERATTPAGTSYLTSADAGVSFRTTFPSNYGDLHVGIYNGDGYSRPEANDQKALQVRVGFRPLPRHAWLRGVRVQGFYDSDAYIADGERTRAILNATFEHKYLNVGADYLDARDQTSATRTTVHGKGWSVWVTPKTTRGWEGLVRYDHERPDVTVPGIRERVIAGVAYWFPRQGSVSSAVLFDVENLAFSQFTPALAAQQRLFVHGLIAF